MKNRFISGVIFIIMSCLLFTGALKAHAAAIADAIYTQGFERVSDYDAYLSGSDSLIDNKVWIEGKAKEYDPSTNSIIVETSLGNWAAYCGDDGTENFKALVLEAIGKNIRVFGKYAGVSEELDLPKVNFIQNNFIEAAYRLESTDNNFRLTYFDYAIGKPDFDQEETYNGMIYSGSSSFIQKGDENTRYYYFDNQTPAFILIHADDISDDAYKSISDDFILDTFIDRYTNSTEYVIRKEKANIGGMKGAFLETTFTDGDMPCSMSLFSYLGIANGHIYYFGCTQPYLASETFKRILPAMLENASYQDMSVSDEKVIPSLAEIVGLYTMTVELSDGSGKTKTDTGENYYFGADDLKSYDETTGICTIEDDDFAMTLTFEFDKDRRVMCHGTVASGSVSGSIIGLKTS
ncbi:hypothetical protein [Butyrivibrio sp. AE3004]|uniref:hypothetical protein n=1 Tax=Butyrivibrio sp. AE3004 TaxID=1506994 RepID=UPI000494BFD9|nr:hypothetical protein [Butyrivibrio sp. AE3004]